MKTKDMLRKFMSRGPVSVASSVILSVLFVTGLVSAATTISTNISTAGTLTVDTTSTLTGLVTTTAGITSGADIISDTDSTDNLGSSAIRWASTFSDNFTGNTITLDGATGINVFTLTNNVADALSVVSSAGDLMVFDTRTDARLINTVATSTVNGNATTTSQGIIMPTAQATVAPATCSATYNGGLIYNSTKRILCLCDGLAAAWITATGNPAACF